MDMNKTLYEVTDVLFVESLTEQIRGILDSTNNTYETSVNKVHNLSHLLYTLEHYTSPTEFESLTCKMKVKIKPKKVSV